MDIKDARIGQNVRTKSGHEGKIIGIWPDQVRIETCNGIHYATPNCIEPVSDSCFAVGDTVRVARKVDAPGVGWVSDMDCAIGKCFVVEKVSADGVFFEDSCWWWPFAALDKIDDSCAACQKLERTRLKAFWEGKASCHEQIAGLLSSRDYWQASCGSARRDAAYWHEELEKLQKEALAETQHFYCDDVVDCRILPFHLRPLSDVAKCYKQVAPEKLLMSQEARRVNHLLDTEGPNDYRSIAMTFGGDWGKTMDGIIELLDAGKIRLVNGKYEIVRD